MLFMITFPLTQQDDKTRVTRFLESGAPPPDGRSMNGRWFTAGHSRGFILAETDDAKLVFKWMSEWADCIDFCIEPVINDEEAGALLQEMM